jgi:excinuclease ABC subunit C
MTSSALDQVPGLGGSRRAALIRHFGSVKRLRDASVEEICAVPGIGPKTAAQIVATLGREGPAATSGVDVGTGEILD